METNTPNPGSNEALSQGCICPVLDNCHGKGIPGSQTFDDGPHFWITADCPVHGKESPND